MARKETPAALVIRRGEQIEIMYRDDALLTDRVRRAVRSNLRRKPSRAETWRVWTMDEKADASVIGELKRNGLRVEVYSQGMSQPRTESRTLSDRAVLGVSEAAPWPVVEAAYRALARMYHPDSTGRDTNAKMREINLAYERLEAMEKRR